MNQGSGEHPFGDAGQLILLVLFLAVWIADSFLLHMTTSLTAVLSLSVRLLILGAIVVIAARLILAGHRAVDHGDTPPQLLTTGAFRYVRHPLYLGCVLVYLGLAVATASLATLAVWVVICLFYDFIAGYEERVLLERYGGEYGAYRERTGKWVPRMRHR